MASKLVAARSAAHRGIPTVVASGMEAGILARILDPDSQAGTLFLPHASPMRSRKHWIAHGLPVRGTLVLDAGALDAVTKKGSSLLPAGVTSIEGDFARGDCVRCTDDSGREVARGLVAYDSAECRAIRGHASARIDALLGYHACDELIHRDDLAVLAELSDPARTGRAKSAPRAGRAQQPAGEEEV